MNDRASYLLAGALAGATAATLVYPLDLLRTLFASHVGLASYGGIFRSVTNIIAEKGILGLYRGLGATLIGITPYTSIKLSIFQVLKNFYYKDKKPNSDLLNFVFGGFSGCVAITLTYPTDLIRRRFQITVLQNNNIKVSYLDVARNILNTEGVRGLYTGLGITYLKFIPLTAITLMTNEKLKKIVQLS